MANPVKPIQFTQFKAADFQDENLGYFNNVMSQMANAINAGNGATGKTQLPAGIDVQGATVSGIGEPQTPTDAVSKGHAQREYSAAALAPQLEAGSGSSSSLKTFRALNSKAQQENNSVFLESILNTSPTSNSSLVSATAPSGGSVTATITAGQHLYVSGKIVTYSQRSDTLSLPPTFNISSISRAGNVVTVVTSSSSGFTTGDGVVISGVTDTSFDGTFVLASGSGTTLTYNEIGPNATSTGGTVSTGTCYYYYLSRGSKTLALAGPFVADTQQQRTTVNIDGTVLIATVVLNGSGLDLSQSAAGATPPSETGNARILTRL